MTKSAANAKNKVAFTKASLASLGITDADWNAWATCPDDQLEECLLYECARESAMWPTVFEKLRDSGGVEKYEIGDDGWARIYEFLGLFPEFPNEPWLNIPEEVRTLRLAVLGKRVTRPPAIEIMGSPLETHLDFQNTMSVRTEESLGPTWPTESPILNKYRKVWAANLSETLLVDWERSDDELIDCFKQILVERRASRFPKHTQGGRPVSGPSAQRTVLKYLAALRLTKAADSGVSLKSIAEATFVQTGSQTEFLYLAPKRIREASAQAVPHILSVSSHQIGFRVSGDSNKPIPCFPTDTLPPAYECIKFENGNIVFCRSDDFSFLQHLKSGKAGTLLSSNQQKRAL